MRRRLAIVLIFAAVLSAPRLHAAGNRTHIAFDAPRAAVVMGNDIARTDWPVRLASPSKEGQFEVLVRKSATPVQAPRCKSQYLVIRMPASVAVGHDLAIQAEVSQKLSLFDYMMQAYTSGRPIHFDVFAGPYGRRDPNGQIVLSGCNMFFEKPIAPHS